MNVHVSLIFSNAERSYDFDADIETSFETREVMVNLFICVSDRNVHLTNMYRKLTEL